MAKFKRGNLDLKTNQKIRLGDSLESQITFDGDSLLIKNEGSSQLIIDAAGLTLASGASVNEFSTDTLLSSNSDIIVPTQKAVRTYIDTQDTLNFLSKPQTVLGNASINRDGYNMIVYPTIYSFPSVSSVESIPRAVKIYALQNSTFILAWADQNSEEAFMQIFNRHVQSLFDSDFEGDPVYDIDIEQLENDEIVIAWILGETEGSVKFRRYNTRLGALGSEVVVESSDCHNVGICQLASRKFIVTYDNSISGNLEYTIFNYDDSVASTGTIEAITLDTPSIPLTLKNGNAFIVWNPDNDNILKFMILDPDGNVVKAAANISSTQAVSGDGDFDATVLPAGNILIAYCSDDDDSARRIIYDQLGNLVKSELNFGSSIASADYRYISTTYTVDGDGFIQVYDSNGDTIYEYVTDPLGSAILTITAVTTNPSGTVNIFNSITLTGGYIYSNYYEGGREIRFQQYKSTNLWTDGYLQLENGESVNEFSSDERLVDDVEISFDYKVPTEKAVRSYIDSHYTAETQDPAFAYRSSAVALKEYWGMEADNDFDNITEQLQFGTSDTLAIHSTPVSDDSILVTYIDSTAVAGYFSVINSDGTETIDKQKFNGAISMRIDDFTGNCATLSNGNVVIIFVDDVNDDGYFRIFSPETGDFISGTETIFVTGSISEVQVLPLKNGGFMITWENGVQGGRFYQIYRFDGTAVFSTDRQVSGTTTNGPIVATEISDGKIAFMFRPSGPTSAVWLQVVDIYIDDTVSQYNTIGTSTDHPEVLLLSSGAIAVTYDEQSGGNILNLMIFDENADVISGPTALTGVISQLIDNYERKMVALPNGDFIIFYSYTSGANPGDLYYQIYDSKGNQLVGETQIVGPTDVTRLDACMLRDGGISVVYTTSSNTQHFLKLEPPGITIDRDVLMSASKSTEWNPTPTNNNEWSGDMTTLTVDTTASDFGYALYMNSNGDLDLADADSTATMPVRVVALETGDGSKKVLLRGFIRDDTWTWIPGGTIFASTTAGGMTQTTPSGSGDLVQVLGFATHADRMYFNPEYTVIEVV